MKKITTEYFCDFCQEQKLKEQLNNVKLPVEIHTWDGYYDYSDNLECIDFTICDECLQKLYLLIKPHFQCSNIDGEILVNGQSCEDKYIDAIQNEEVEIKF